ncbi:hypothetical protein WUBG_16827 [Wuchereria bancrofti]|uniref:Stalled ribosome sensor GCN1-like N-terminal domain-containing protein n=1 Tax=Wuchereria bancrofti TaxID=6293 RepID=J9DRJ0_WUCBA|nr:hypothetical protein WUBG_16827 [Wuchereria bancrofti]
MAVVKKSMLRSPEIAIFGILYLLESITIDLSSFAIDFYKILSASLISSISEVRGHTSLSVAMVAKKITDPKALKGLVDEIFGTYSGFVKIVLQKFTQKKIKIVGSSLEIKTIKKWAKVRRKDLMEELLLSASASLSWKL